MSFDQGTLLLHGPDEQWQRFGDLCVRDGRVGAWRARALAYATIVGRLHQEGTPYRDLARAYEPCRFVPRALPPPRDYQEAALRAWQEAGRRGVIVLPTGSGKSLVADLAIAATGRPTLVVVPTIDLMEQWASQLERCFGGPVGLLGGGSKDVQPLTVSTYESAALMMEFIGNRFGLLIVDECHHLPGPSHRQVATLALAPFRLGLTATPERQDEGEALLYELLGPLCFRRDIDELEGHVLAPYAVRRQAVELDPDEAEDYRRHRQVYTEFVRANGIDFSRPDGWGHFVGLCARHPHGREVFNAYLAQKRIARGGRAKFRALWDIFRRHPGERLLIFTADNDTAYEIGRRFYLPVLTHRTSVRERKDFLDAFRRGEYLALVTSKVLNEGIDVPEASVGVVVSGSGSTREHVQRLGRILRPARGKQACLYELVSLGTSETYVSERRRQHRAYQRPAAGPR